jgi:hypothetical protein
MYPRNAASPERIAVGPVVAIADGAVQTSGVSVKVMPQGGAAGASAGTVAYEEGIVHYLPTQAETNYTSFMVIAYKASCIPASVTVVTTASSVPGNVQLAAAQPATTFATLTVTGACTHGSTVLGNTTAGTITQTGAASWGASTFASITSTAAFTCGSTVLGNTTMGTLTQTGAASLGVGSTVTFATLAVTGALSASSTSLGNTTAGTIGATSITLSGTLQAATIVSTGTTTLNALTVTGAATHGSTSLGNVTAGTVTQSGAASWGASTFASIAVTGALSVGTTTTLTGNVSLGGTLAVTGTTTLTGAVSHGSTTTYTGAFTLTDMATAASVGKYLADILADTNELQTDDTPGALAALESHGDSTWATATGFSTLSASDVEDAVWDADTADHDGAGTTGAALAAAGLAADPWLAELPGDYEAGSAGYIIGGFSASSDPWGVEIPGAYGAGTAGKIVGDNLNATVSSRSSHSAADVWAVATRVLTANTNLNDPTAATIADAVWDEASTGHTDAGKAGAQMWTDIDAILDDTDLIDDGTSGLAKIATDVAAILLDTAVIGAAGAGLTAVPWNAAWDAEVQSECTDALNAYDPPTNAEMEARTLAAAAYATAAALATVDGIVDDILVDTGTTLDALLKRVAVICIGDVTQAGTDEEIFVYGSPVVTATVTVDIDGNRSIVWS